MLFQLAIGGMLPKDGNVVQSVRRQLELICGRLAGEGCQALVSPSYTAPEWQPLIRETGASVFGFCKSGDPDWSGFCEKSVWEDTTLRSVVGEAMCNRADLVLAVWNEDVAECLGASWELIQIAHREKTPCLWVSSKTGTVYWSKGSYFERFDPAVLDRLFEAHQAAEPASFPDADKPLPLLSFAVALRHRFLNKYRAVRPETEPVEDRILKDGFSLESERAGAESVRRNILEQFYRFDQSAITLNTQYQSILYWRAVLPILATIFLAVGFYADPLLNIAGIPNVAARLAGVGFLIHGLLNLYVYLLSENKVVKAKHRAFLQNRYIAEILRVLIHFVPYGIYPDLRNMCGGSEETRAAIQRMILGAEPDTQRVDGGSGSRALCHIREMLQDQIAYHTAAAGRYRRITNRLDKWYKVIVGTGFAVVILRGVFQFYVSVSPLQGNIVDGVSLNGYVRSFANMVALMLPAWAGYFSTKLTLCNFKFNCDNHTRMAERLGHTLAQVEQLETVEGGAPIDVLYTLSEELTQIMIVEDTQIWERKYEGSTVTRL